MTDRVALRATHGQQERALHVVGNLRGTLDAIEDCVRAGADTSEARGLECANEGGDAARQLAAQMGFDRGAAGEMVDAVEAAIARVLGASSA